MSQDVVVRDVTNFEADSNILTPILERTSSVMSVFYCQSQTHFFACSQMICHLCHSLVGMLHSTHARPCARQMKWVLLRQYALRTTRSSKLAFTHRVITKYSRGSIFGDSQSLYIFTHHLFIICISFIHCLSSKITYFDIFRGFNCNFCINYKAYTVFFLSHSYLTIKCFLSHMCDAVLKF